MNVCNVLVRGNIPFGQMWSIFWAPLFRESWKIYNVFNDDFTLFRNLINMTTRKSQNTMTCTPCLVKRIWFSLDNIPLSKSIRLCVILLKEFRNVSSNVCRKKVRQNSFRFQRNRFKFVFGYVTLLKIWSSVSIRRPHCRQFCHL